MPRESGSLSNYFYFGEAFEWEVIRFLRAFARPGDVIVDGGANVGMFTYASWQAVSPSGNVHSFEPIAQCAETIRLNVEGNGLGGRVLVHGAALSDHQGTVRFTSDLDVSNHMAWSQHSASQSSVLVPTARVDEVVEPPVALIKLDVEGAEFLALKGCEGLTKSDSPPYVLIVEALDHSLRKLGSSRQEVTGLLDTWGYDPVVMTENPQELSAMAWGEITHGDLICVRRDARALVEARVRGED
jgi:FkbM family methyltransferase